METRRGETEHGAEAVEELGTWPLPDTNGAIALDVAVATHRTEARANLPDLAPKQVEIDDLLNVGDGVHMLGEAHSPTGDRALGLREHVGGPENVVVRYAARGDDPLPGGSRQRTRIGIEAVRRSSDEIAVERLLTTRIALQQRLRHSLKQRHVAADANAQEEVGDLRAPTEQAEHLLRLLEAPESRLGERIDADDRRPIALGALQRREHPWMVRARILAGNKDRLRLIEVLERHRALADADRLHQRRAARLVTHVRAVGEIVGAKLPNEQLIEKGSLVRRAPRGIEDGFIGRVERFELGGDEREGVVPGDRLVVRLAA